MNDIKSGGGFTTKTAQSPAYAPQIPITFGQLILSMTSGATGAAIKCGPFWMSLPVKRFVLRCKAR